MSHNILTHLSKNYIGIPVYVYYIQKKKSLIADVDNKIVTNNLKNVQK